MLSGLGIHSVVLSNWLPERFYPAFSPAEGIFPAIRFAMSIRYTVKMVSDFPVPSRDDTYQTLPGRE